MAERLSKGKTLVVMLVICFLAVAVGLIAQPGILSVLMFIVASGLLLLFLVVLVSWLKKTAGINKENFHQIEQHLKSIQQENTLLKKQAEKNSADIALQVSRINELNAASETPNRSTDSILDGKDNLNPFGLGSLFAQGALPSAKVIKQNSTGSVGRKAAAIEIEKPSISNLEIVLNAETEKWTKNLAVIVPTEIKASLDKKHNVTALSPNRTEIITNSNFDYIIVDERSSRQGTWSNFLDTFRLSTYLDLSKALRAARSRGSIILVIEDDVSSSLTNSLREHADIKLRPGHQQTSGNYEALEIYRDLKQLTFEEEYLND